MILSQVPASALPDPNHFASIGWAIIVIFGLSGGLYYFLALLDRIKGKPQVPPNRQLESAQKDLERRVTLVEAAVTGVRTEMQAEREVIEEKARERSLRIYEKIDETRDQMARGFQDIERTLGRLEGRIGS